MACFSVLFAALAAAQTSPAAVRVLGQVDFLHNGPGLVEGREFFQPWSAVVDRSSTPNRLFVSDANNHRILGWRDAGAVANGQAADLVIGQPDLLTTTVGAGDAGLSLPRGLALDGSGNLYVADTGNNRVLVFNRPFEQTGRVRARAVLGQTDFTAVSAGTAAARLAFPLAVAVDGSGRVAVADFDNDRVLIFTLVQTGAAAAIVLGQPDFTSTTASGVPAQALLPAPVSVAVNSAGNIFVGDGQGSRVLQFPPASALPATGGQAVRVLGQAGFADRCTVASLSCIAATPGNINLLALAAPGDDLYVGDSDAARVLVFRNVSSLPVGGAAAAGSFGQPSPVPGPGTLSLPSGLALDANNSVYVVDSTNHRVLRFANPLSGASAERVLGQQNFAANGINLTDGRGFPSPFGLALDANSRPMHLYLVDPSNNRVLAWRNAEDFSNGQSADLALGQADLTLLRASEAGLNDPFDVAVDASGNLYVSYAGLGGVAVYPPPFESGSREPSRTINMPRGATNAEVPNGIAVDAAGNLFVTTPLANRVLQFAPGAGGAATPVRIFGQPDLNSFTANTGGLSARSLSFPLAVATDSSGNLYIADTRNHRVLQYANVPALPPAAPAATRVFGQASFTASTAGTGISGLSGPAGVTADGAGNLYVADSGNNRVVQYLRTVPPGGTPVTGAQAARLLGQAGFDTSFAALGPAGLWLALDITDSNGGRTGLAAVGSRLLVSDTNNHRGLLFQLAPPQTLQAVFGSGQTGSAGRPLAPFVVRVTDSAGTPAAGVAVFFTVAAGGGGVNPAMAFTDSSGEARTVYTPGAEGTAQVTAAVPGMEAGLTFSANISGAAPGISPRGIVNGASFAPGDTPLAPGGIISIFGQGFLTPGTAPLFAPAVPLPTALGGVQVRVLSPIGERAAALFYVSERQINCQLPAELTENPVRIYVRTGVVATDPVTITLASTAPGLFSQDSSGSGPGAILNQNLSPNSADNPEARGNVIVIYGTGQGAVEPAVQTGAPAPQAEPLARTGSTPVVTVGGRPATVQYSGLAPNFVGLWQINVVLPADAPTGSAVPVVVSLGSAAGNTVLAAVK